jgi:branched-chain amino acid transport system ATP-binding protein
LAHEVPPALAIRGLNAYYGDSHVLCDVGLHLREGRVLALLGRNGAGKSTCIQSIMGLVKARSGSVELFGQPIRGLAPESISRRGVGLVPQGRRIFANLTVHENLRVAERRARPGAGRAWNDAAVFERFPQLGRRRGQLAGSLSGGEQQMLAIGRALVSNPRVLLLDEPSEGLAPLIVRELGAVLADLKQLVSILLVEQNLGLAMKLADDVVLLNTGRVVFSGTREQFQERQPELQRHLGVH